MPSLEEELISAGVKPSGGFGSLSLDEEMKSVGMTPRPAITDDGILGNLKKGFVSGAAGVGGGLADILHLDSAGDYMQDVIRNNQRQKEFESVIDSDYWLNPSGALYDVANAAGSMAAIAPVAYLLPESAVASGAAGLATLLGRAGLGRAATWAAGQAAKEGAGTLGLGIRGAATSIPEAMAEGGGVRREAIANGLDNPDLRAWTTAAMNVPTLALSNAAEYMLLGGGALRPTAKAGEGMAERVAKAPFRAAPSVGANAAQNAGEELLQQTYSDAVLDKEWGNPLNPYDWTDEQRKAFEVGGVAGGLLSAGPGTVRASQNVPVYDTGHGDIDRIVSDAARRYDLSPELIHKVIQQESGYNPEAVSDAGAQGLMQLMPGTAQGLGVSDSFDPEQNINGGAKYLRQMLDEFNGDVRKALAAYNAGPNNIEAGYGYADEVLGRSVDGTEQASEGDIITRRETSGEGETWRRQTGNVSLEGAQEETLEALELLADWFYQKTGKPLVLTAGTNGNHPSNGSATGHDAGWKLDVNDWGSGAEGTLLGENDGEKGTLTDEFIAYGQSLGLGMNWEGDHIDVSAAGEQWEGPQAGTNFGGLKLGQTKRPRQQGTNTTSGQQQVLTSGRQQQKPVDTYDNEVNSIYEGFIREQLKASQSQEDKDFFGGFFDKDGNFEATKENIAKIEDRVADDLAEDFDKYVEAQETAGTGKKPQPSKPEQTQIDVNTESIGRLRELLTDEKDKAANNGDSDTVFNISKTLATGNEQAIRQLAGKLLPVTQSESVIQNQPQTAPQVQPQQMTSPQEQTPTPQVQQQATQDNQQEQPEQPIQNQQGEIQQTQPQGTPVRQAQDNFAQNQAQPQSTAVQQQPISQQAQPIQTQPTMEQRDAKIIQDAYSTGMGAIPTSKKERVKQGRGLAMVARTAGISLPSGMVDSLRNGNKNAILQAQDIIRNSGVTPSFGGTMPLSRQALSSVIGGEENESTESTKTESKETGNTNNKNQNAKPEQAEKAQVGEAQALKQFKKNAAKVVSDYRKDKISYDEAFNKIVNIADKAGRVAPDTATAEAIKDEALRVVGELNNILEEKQAQEGDTQNVASEATQKDTQPETPEEEQKTTSQNGTEMAKEDTRKETPSEQAKASQNKPQKAREANEENYGENEGKTVENKADTVKEPKLQRMRRGREEMQAVAKKYADGEITQKTAYSKVAEIAKDIATVPKDGTPNVTFIDGNIRRELSDYGNSLIDDAKAPEEKAEAKQEEPAEAENNTVKEYKYYMNERGVSPGAQPKGFTRFDEEGKGGRHGAVYYDHPLTEQEIADYELTPAEEESSNEQQGESGSLDGGHGGVRAGEGRSDQHEGTGEVSGRDGREGKTAGGDNGEENPEESQSAGVRAGTELDTAAGKGTDKRGNQSDVPLTEAQAHPSPTETPGHNYEINDTDQSTKSEKVRFKQNVEAIKMLKQLETDDRMPTPAEQEILAGYNGWGGLKGAFIEDSDMNKEIRELLTEEEYKAARSTINDAFYTPPKLIRAIWEGISHLGFKGGRVLDPSMGVGNFFGTMPRDMMDKSTLRGVELDDLTSRLGKMLYPNAFVEHKGFQKSGVADNYFDLAISNIPFGQNMIDGYQVHNFFFANGIDKVRPGGLMVYITSQGSLAGGKDAVKMRNYLSGQADLIAAYKLPSGVFSDAGTQVATDIVIFRKRDKDGKKSPYGQKFADVKEVKRGEGYYAQKLYDINEYFEAHPENILGEQSNGKDQWGNPALNVKMAEGTTLADVANDLESAIKKLPGDVYQPVSRKKAKAFDTASAQKRAAAAEKTRDYEYYYKDGKPVQNQNGQEVAVTGQKAKIVDSYLKLKNTLNALFAAESDPKATSKQVESVRKKLNKDYDAFVAKHGLLTGKAAAAFRDDPSAGMVQALEKPQEETYKDKKGNERKRIVGAEKADIFSVRSIKPVQEVTHVESADDALLASLTNRGGVDLDYMAGLMNSKPEKLVSQLKGKVFKNPVTEDYETRDEYLSGNVREKLAQAKEAAKSDKAYADNVKELEKVVPEDLVADEIYVNLGTPWIPISDVQDFVNSIADGLTVKFSRGAALWNVTGWGRSAKYKLQGITLDELLDHVLNNKAIQIFDGSGDNKVFNKEKTDAANVAAEELQQDFRDWIWKDKEREKRLTRYYNDNYNNTVVRQYNGQHLNLHDYGMNAKITLKPHQKDVVWRMLQGQNTLIAHCVGAGKTFEMQAAGMEMRRLGIANKPMYCLPNNVVQQFAREFRILYPNAKLLVLQSNDLPAVEKTSKLVKTEDGRTKRESLLNGKTPEQKATIMAKRTARNRMLNRIRTEDWDGIIISHNLFQRFPVTPDTAAAFIQQEIDNLEQTIREARADKSMDTRALSNLENAKKNLEERLEDAISTDIEDIGVPFEELGVDQLFVDEADMFKNLEFATRLGNIRGLSNSKANRSRDMFIKTQWLTNTLNGRGVVFATGTPVSNTMSELYTMMRYLDMKGLKEKGLELFDNWLRTFGDIGQGIERKPTGDGFRKVTMIKRFINMAELTKMFRKFADVKVQEELNLNIPKLKNGKSTVVALEPDPKVVNYIKNVVPERVKNMKSGFKKEKGEDNMLSLTNDLRKLSLTDSKIEACADAIVRKYHETTETKGTQLVFCDMGIPKAEKGETALTDKDGEAVAAIESPEVYRKLIEKLKKKGIPEKDIAFIQNYNTKQKRDDVFQKVNKGEVRILIGSTETMGAGTNCQTHLVALHDLDAPWRPRDLEQRHGRILRQGNENEEVEIYNYVVKDSFDANMWEKLKNKAAIIQQAMSGDMNMRTVEDSDLVTLSYAEVEGAATGNPLIKEQLQVQNDLTKYQHAQTAFRKKVRDAENTLDGADERVDKKKREIAKVEKDIAQRKDTKGDKFSMLIGKSVYKERGKADEALAKLLGNLSKRNPVEIGQIGGFRLMGYYDGVEPKLSLVNNLSYDVNKNSVQGIEYVLNHAPETELANLNAGLERMEKDIAQAEEIVKQENPYAEKVKALSERLNQLNREIAETLVEDGKQQAQEEGEKATSPNADNASVGQVESKEETPQTQETQEKPSEQSGTVNFEAGSFRHTKTGEMIPQAKLKDGSDSERNKRIAALAKNYGGKWSRYSKSLLFKSEAKRDEFLEAAEALLASTDPETMAKLSITAWHGSPHKFDSFSLQSIGTGEGTQVHGWGLYFAQDRGVSEGYRSKLTGSYELNGKLYTSIAGDFINEQGKHVKATTPEGVALESLLFHGGKVDEAKAWVQKNMDTLKRALSSVKKKEDKEYVTGRLEAHEKAFDLLENGNPKTAGGSLFQVEIPDEEVMLDEQRAINDQPMRNTLHDILESALTNEQLRRWARGEFPATYKDTMSREQAVEVIWDSLKVKDGGREFYQGLSRWAMETNGKPNPKAASELLHDYGIKGITYEGEMDGRCYVVFDDQAIDIIERFSAEAMAESEIRRMMMEANPVDNEKLTPQQRKLSALGKELGSPVIWMDGDSRLHGWHQNGFTFLNVNSKADLEKTFWHETFHWIRSNNEHDYAQIVKEVQESDRITKEQMDKWRKKTGRFDLSDEDVIEEMLCDSFYDAAGRVKELRTLANHNVSLAQRVMAWIKRLADRFNEFMHGREGGLTTSQRDNLTRVVGKLAATMKDGKGRPIFGIYRNGAEIRLANGQFLPAVSFSASGESTSKTNNRDEASSAPKFSYSSSDNSTPSLTQRIRNILSGVPNNDQAKEMYRKTMATMLEDALGVKIKYGKTEFPQGETVIYKEKDKTIRSKHAYDWENILPVAGGLIAERLGISDKASKTTPEMKNYIADWILTGAANNTSPEARQFQKAMANHPAYADKLIGLRTKFQDWMDKTAQEKMQQTVQWTKGKSLSWKERKDLLYEQFVEELAPIEKLVQNFEKATGKKLEDIINPMTAFRLFRGSYGRAITMIEGIGDAAVDGLRMNFPGVDFTGFKTLRTILADIGALQNQEKQKDFGTYCIACHMMDMHKSNNDIILEQKKFERWIQEIKDGKRQGDEKTIEEYEKTIRELQEEIYETPPQFSWENCEMYIREGKDKYDEAQKALVRFSNVTAAILANSGVISYKHYTDLLKKWPNYVPLFRVFEENENIDFGDSMKKLAGSTRDIVNPIESIIHNTVDFIKKAEKNRAKCLLADLARCEGSGWLIEEVDNSKPNTKTTVTFYENGVRKYLETDPAIVEAINNMDRSNSNTLMKFIHAITAMARACFTIASPEFAVRNVFRDYADMTVYNKFGFVSPADWVRGLIHAMNRDSTYYEWLSSGAAMASAVSLDRNYTQEMVDKLNRSWGRRFASKQFGKALLEALQKVGEYSEYATRISMYEKAKKATMKNQKADIQAAIVTAALQSRDLMDFSRHGKAGEMWNKWVPFANASLQGMNKFYRTMFDPKQYKNKKELAWAWARLALSSVLPAMVLFLAHHDDDWYKEAPDWLKETHWLFKIGDTVIRIPKGSDVGIRFISNLVEKGMAEAYGEDKYKFLEYFKPLMDAIPDLFPIILKPMTEAMLNKSFFTKRNIVPQYQEKLPEKLQYGPYTTGLSKVIGEALGIAPSKIDHVIAGYTGSMGMAFPKAIDLALGTQQLDLAPTEMPLTRSITYMPYKNPRSVQKFYEMLDEQTKYENEYKLTKKRPEELDSALLERLKATKKHMTKLSKEEKDVINNPNLTLEQRKKRQMDIQQKRINLVKQVVK